MTEYSFRASYPHHRFHILLIEDDPGDVDLIAETLEDIFPAAILHTVDNGNDALNFLRGAIEAGAVVPDLVLLDLNLPGLSGRQILQKIKTTSRLQHIPVIILTTSTAETDIQSCYSLGANCYASKPVGLEAFTAMVKSIGEFWLTMARLPVRPI